MQKRVLGQEHLDTLKTVMGLATALYTQGQHAKAAVMFRDMLGQEHPDTLRAAMNLAHALDEQGQHVEAAANHRETLEVQKRVLGLSTPTR